MVFKEVFGPEYFNPEHVQILAMGVDTWNSWRKDHPNIVPALSGTDLRPKHISHNSLRGETRDHGFFFSDLELREADYRGADFTGAKLFQADLSAAWLSQTKLDGADLRGAWLIRTRLDSASLRNANLSKANLRKANLREADLIGAQLIAANLSRTNLLNANLTGADLAWANLSQSCLVGADLSFSKVYQTNFSTQEITDSLGIHRLHHQGPSIVDQETLERTEGKLPSSFLNKIGFKDWNILSYRLHDPNLRPDQVIDITYKIADMRTNSPIQTNSIFFSYSSKDASFVEAIEKRFNEDHINSWRDVHEISAGPIEAQLERAINLNGTVLLVLSKNSVHSEWVKYEVRKARKLRAKLEQENEKQMHVLCPVALDYSWKNCAWPPRIREDLEDYHILDCSDWQEPSFDVKYEKLKTNLGIYYFGQDRK